MKVTTGFTSVVTLARMLSEGSEEMALLQISLSRNFTMKGEEDRARIDRIESLRGSFPF